MIKFLILEARLWLAEFIVPKSHRMTWSFTPVGEVVDLSPSEYRRIS